ncbi:uncharacterized protein LOC106670112 [Cimex lectularius]|uniref:Uncharacterized protein n=1 Tax=Cimex lectularius TaxID=79782 RepID=A0A8I6TJI1_CIMLE|nr:uncharacterized protein LOC106670112 [Cimex lectularius]XP_014255649.1 uncharacterized protein LOC106670112 [Cimex lectularius]XP_014255650.1 uncharacterized protein LOC106670112 [Cimex lectularius]XP_014255651.1 uncharacterized protein LOC106670112 [Cimex lectularius]
MSPKKSELEETDAEKVPLRQVRRTLAVHMDKEKERYFEWCKGKQKDDCSECEGYKTSKKHNKYWDSKSKEKQEKKDNCACRGVHNGGHRRHLRLSSPDMDHKFGKNDIDRIVENAVIEWDYFKNKKKSMLDTLGTHKEKAHKTESKPKTSNEKTQIREPTGKYLEKSTKSNRKLSRDENDIYGEHIAMQLRKLKNPKTVALARLKIDKVIYNASIGNRKWTHKQLEKIIEYRKRNSPPNKMTESSHTVAKSIKK